MIQPVEMRTALPIELHGGVLSTTQDVWSMLKACADGELAHVLELVRSCPALLTCQYDYTTPLHMAVREGHLELARWLIERRALDPTYLTHPFRDSLVTMAQDRGRMDIAELLRRSLDDPQLTHPWGETGRVDYRQDDVQRRFQALVDKHQYDDAETLLQKQPDLAKDEFAFWAEGILMMPAKDGDRQMLELLMRHGARVPDVSKWGARYYFRHYEIAAFLLQNGMNPNHTNWRGFTLLHDMAFLSDVHKAALLLDHGANIDAIDDEHRSTPLGYAVRYGHREMVAFLLKRGADPNRAGAPWAMPLAWAGTRRDTQIESDLKHAGAR